MYAIGLFLSLIIGVVLGLVGGGGSILTVPLVNYFFDETMYMATTYSLFVVAVAAAFGFIQRIKHQQVDFQKGLIFVLPSMLVAFGIRKFIMPLFPISFSVSEFELSRDIVITILLILVMLYTGFKTLLPSSNRVGSGKTSILTIIAFGVLTGILSGFIGAGGGFIIVPILLRMGLDMKKAVGTSMFIIAIQSSVALMGDLMNPEITNSGGFNWPLLLAITGITVGGVVIGGIFQKKVSGSFLRTIFSYIILIVAAGLIIKMATN